MINITYIISNNAKEFINLRNITSIVNFIVYKFLINFSNNARNILYYVILKYFSIKDN